MASCSEACGCGSGGESSGSEAGPGCLQFGVRSYLHQFYEGCAGSVREGDPEGRGYGQERRSPAPRWSSGLWKLCLALGALALTSGVACVAAGYSAPPRLQSFGDGELFFTDPRAASFNRGLRRSVAAGIGLSCLGSGLAAAGLLLWSSRTPKGGGIAEGEEGDGGGRERRRRRREGEAVTAAPEGEGKASGERPGL